MKDLSIRKYDYIDAIRGFAILGVVLVHSSQWVTPVSVILKSLANQGARGVQLFYMASALTLFLSMNSRKNLEYRPVLSFFVRRFCRIAPMFYLAIIAYVLYEGMSARYWAPNGLQWWYVPLTAFFLHGWNPETINSVVPGGWSIAVEMTFYLVVPYLFIKLNNILSAFIALFLSLILEKVLTIGVVFYLSPYFPDSQQYLVDTFTTFWFFSQLPIFILGILLYHVIKNDPSSDKRKAWPLLFIASLFFTFCLSMPSYLKIVPDHFSYGIAFWFFCLSLHYLPHPLFVNRITVVIGRLSFSIYLVHFMVLNLMNSLFPNGFIINGNIGFVFVFCLVLTLSALISFATHHLVEIPGINYGKKIINNFQKCDNPFFTTDASLR